MNNLKKLTEGTKFAYILKKYNKLTPEIYPELAGKKYRKLTRYRLENLLRFSQTELKQEISVVELEIFSKMLRIEPKELLNQ